MHSIKSTNKDLGICAGEKLSAYILVSVVFYKLHQTINDDTLLGLGDGTVYEGFTDPEDYDSFLVALFSGTSSRTYFCTKLKFVCNFQQSSFSTMIHSQQAQVQFLTSCFGHVSI